MRRQFILLEIDWFPILFEWVLIENNLLNLKKSYLYYLINLTNDGYVELQLTPYSSKAIKFIFYKFCLNYLWNCKIMNSRICWINLIENLRHFCSKTSYFFICVFGYDVSQYDEKYRPLLCSKNDVQIWWNVYARFHLAQKTEPIVSAKTKIKTC